MTSGTIITVAPTGAEADPAELPGLPVTVPEQVASAVACQAAGAGIVHVHIRDDDARPTLDLGRLRETVAALRAETDLVVQLSTGGAVSDPEPDRLRVLEAEPEMASCSMGTVNFGDEVFVNRWPFIVALHTRMQELGVVPEYEIFDLGHVWSLARLLERYGLPVTGQVHVDLVLGVPGGMPGTPATLLAAVDGLRQLPEGTTFSATGIGRTTLPVALTALAAGGHLRVGMEDTRRYARGQPVESNAQLVGRVAELARLAQRPPVSPTQTRHLLGITDR